MVSSAYEGHCQARTSRVRGQAAGHADQKAVKAQTEVWYRIAKKAAWSNPADVKAAFRTASILKENRAVFNLCGNNYRLVVKINYVKGIVYIRFVGSHKQYDAINAEKV
jgi:mRNA interferase HigB